MYVTENFLMYSNERYQMSDIESKLQHFEQQLQQLAEDLDVLQQLNSIKDTNTQLNKIRYISEAILHNLCMEHNIGWGKAEPTLERMVGPLRAANILPSPIVSLFRSIQSTTSPGSHYQKDKLTDSHSQIALLALVDILEWYVTYTGVQNIPTTKSQSIQKRHAKPWFFLVLGICFCVGVFGYMWKSNEPTGKMHPMERMEEARGIVLQFQKQVSSRHFLMSQLLLQIKNIESTDEQFHQQTFEKYRTVLQEYNMERSIYRTDIENIFGTELYLWEREIHHELFYAGRNLECLIRKDGNKDQLIQQMEQHLTRAQNELESFALFSRRLLETNEKWPVPVTKIKKGIDANLENPCSKN